MNDSEFTLRGPDVVGHCSKCGIVRQDAARGTNVTDCKCTALMRHDADCGYAQSVSCPIDMGFRCEKHGEDPCEECECTCRPSEGRG